jgi:hypothetical protein
MNKHQHGLKLFSSRQLFFAKPDVWNKKVTPLVLSVGVSPTEMLICNAVVLSVGVSPTEMLICNAV